MGAKKKRSNNQLAESKVNEIKSLLIEGNSVLEIANKVQVMQAWKSSFGSFQQSKQEFFQNLFSYSKANNQLHIARLSDYFADNHTGWQIKGKDVGLLTEESVYVSVDEIVSLANRLMLPANKEKNLLMEQAFEILSRSMSSGNEGKPKAKRAKRKS